jgi:cytochrome b
MASNEVPERLVYVWDAPTRIFHWMLAILVVVAWLTGEGEGAAAFAHRAAGAAIAGLLAFRLIWGFVGGEHARFADFAFAPAAVMRYARALAFAKPVRHLGHNPLGAVAVFLILANLIVIVATGLMSAGDHSAGPFAGAAGESFAEVHELAFRVLQGLVTLHIIGVVVETIATRDALAPAMITGYKRRRPDEAGADARRAGAVALVAALCVGIGLAVSLMMAPSNPRGPEGAAAIDVRED